MPGQVFSTRIWSGSVLTGAQVTIGTVPTGKRLIIRSVNLTWGTGTGNYCLLSFSASFVELARVDPAGAGAGSIIQDCRLVLHETETLNLRNLGSATMVGSIHGYLMSANGGPVFS